MILVDTNIIMYAAGAAHPHKNPSVGFLERVARGEVEASICAETLQEILHRYRSISRWDEGKKVYDLARQIFPVVIPITSVSLDRARELLDQHSQLMARDALHAAVLFVEGLDELCSYDRDFDQVRDLKRVEP